MSSLFTSGRARLGLIIAVIIGAALLVACDPPTDFPEPLNDAACWEQVGEPLPSTVGGTESYWDWDGESDTATYYSYGCGEDPLEEYCGRNIYTYTRVCELPGEEPTPEPTEEPTPEPEPIVFACDVDDGSLNAYHCGRPVAIYRGSFAIWGVDPNTAEGALAFEITGEQIAAAGIPEAEPALIAEGTNPFTQAAIHVFRLPTGEFQLNTWYVGGKPYVVKWAEGDTFVSNLLW